MDGLIEDTNDAENPGVPGGRAISRRGEEARGGFVLRAKSDETPHRRRSLVERSGMKNFVQVNHFGIFATYICIIRQNHLVFLTGKADWKIKSNSFAKVMKTSGL